MSFFKKLATGAVNRFSGRTDLLEAVVAGAALVAYADGHAADHEIETTITAVKANATLKANFDDRTIESTIDKIFERAKGGRVGRMGLYSEVEDVASNPEHAELVMYTVLDVADNDGISAEEEAVIKSIAQRLRVDYNRFLAA